MFSALAVFDLEFLLILPSEWIYAFTLQSQHEPMHLLLAVESTLLFDQMQRHTAPACTMYTVHSIWKCCLFFTPKQGKLWVAPLKSRLTIRAVLIIFVEIEKSQITETTMMMFWHKLHLPHAQKKYCRVPKCCSWNVLMLRNVTVVSGGSWGFHKMSSHQMQPLCRFTWVTWWKCCLLMCAGLEGQQKAYFLYCHTIPNSSNWAYIVFFVHSK